MKEFESCEKCKYRYKSEYEYPCERCVHGCVIEEYYEPMTNGDRIRAMSDEELAELLYSFIDSEEKIAYCKNKDVCLDTLNNEETIPSAMCKQCLIDWLQQEIE